MSEGICCPKIIHFPNFLSHQTVTIRNIIPKVMSKNNTKKSQTLSGIDKFDPIKGAINQAADILMDNPEYALSQGLVKNFSTCANIIPNDKLCNYPGRRKRGEA